MGKAEAEILRILQQTGETYQSELVKATGFSKGTVSEALSRLVERRLARRVALGKNWRVYPVVEKEGGSGPSEAGGRRRRDGKKLCLGFTRAAEYPFLVPFKKALRDAGVELEFKVYENGIGVARDLSLSRIDLGIAPIITLFMFYSLEAPIKILAIAGSGGASILRGIRSSSSPATVTCTRISTMELMMRSAMRGSVIPDATKVIYASGPDQMQRMLASGTAGVECVWEPYATILEAQGAQRVIRYSELTEHICCALAAGNQLSEKVLSKVFKQYELSLDLFRRDPDPHLSAYGALSGLETSLLRRVSREYSYPRDISPSVVEHQLENAGIVLPSPISFKDALLGP